LHQQLLPSSMTSKRSTLWGSWSWKKKKILKWGAMSTSTCQILRNREYTRAFYFSKKKIPKGSRGDPLKIVEQLGCKNGSYSNMCDESRRVARTLTRGIFSLGRTDTNDFLFKLAPPKRKKEQTMRMRCQRAYVDMLIGIPNTAPEEHPQMMASIHTSTHQLREWLLGLRTPR